MEICTGAVLGKAQIVRSRVSLSAHDLPALMLEGLADCPVKQFAIRRGNLEPEGIAVRGCNFTRDLDARPAGELR